MQTIRNQMMMRSMQLSMEHDLPPEVFQGLFSTLQMVL